MAGGSRSFEGCFEQARITVVILGLLCKGSHGAGLEMSRKSHFAEWIGAGRVLKLTIIMRREVWGVILEDI